ncbi:MAG: hypothetical protein P1P88_04130 [Bacteroidales bacterium]|nr:hypothetical protein [Bacteroidales bacterium]
MAHLNHMGPDEKGPKTGRKLGRCKLNAEELLQKNNHQIGEGLGRKKKDKDCKESGKRLKAGKNIS